MAARASEKVEERQKLSEAICRCENAAIRRAALDHLNPSASCESARDGNAWSRTLDIRLKPGAPRRPTPSRAHLLDFAREAKRNPSNDGIAVRCWGTRGSIPSPGPKTVEYGGNTTCLEVCGADLRIVFDAGSGIRPLGQDLVERGPNAVHIFLTHFHWDHIQGFPFFAPLYDPEDVIKVIGPKQKDIDVQNLFAGQMGPIYFPVPFSFVAAEVEFEHLNEGGYEVGDFDIEVMRVRHPSFVIGYRIKIDGHVICFIPDNELEGDMYSELEPGFRKRLVEFCGDADLLIHDSMYTEEEYPHRHGWGHSTFEQTLRLGQDAGVKKLLFSHHDPMRTDYEISAIVAKMREDAARSGGQMIIDAAREGIDYRMDGDA